MEGELRKASISKNKLPHNILSKILKLPDFGSYDHLLLYDHVYILYGIMVSIYMIIYRCMTIKKSPCDEAIKAKVKILNCVIHTKRSSPNLSELINLYSPINYQKTIGFEMISGQREVN